MTAMSGRREIDTGTEKMLVAFGQANLFEKARQQPEKVKQVLQKIRTDGLLLRPWRMDDAPALAVACEDPEIARWLPMIPSPYTEETAREFRPEASLSTAH